MVTVEYKLKNENKIVIQGFKGLRILKCGAVRIYFESYDIDGYLMPYATIEEINDVKIKIEINAE